MLKHAAKVGEEEKKSHHSSDSIEIRLPKIRIPSFRTFNWRNMQWTPPLVLTIIIMAFLLGASYTRIQSQDKELKGLANGTNVVANAAAPSAAPTLPPPSGNTKPVSSTDLIRGSSDAKVTLVEFADEECPYCIQFHPTMLQLMKDYAGKIRWVYRTYPLSFHANAEPEAEATLCAQSLGGNDVAWQFIDYIFANSQGNGTGFALDKLGPLAAQVGIDQTTFQSCLDSKKFAQAVKDETADGNTAGVNGTPTTIILVDGKKPNVLVGAQPIDAMKAAIDAALK